MLLCAYSLTSLILYRNTSGYEIDVDTQNFIIQQCKFIASVDSNGNIFFHKVVINTLSRSLRGGEKMQLPGNENIFTMRFC